MTESLGLLGGLGHGSGVRRIWRLSRGNRTLAGLQSALFVLEGVVEASILTLFARVALVTVQSDSSGVSVPTLGERTVTFALGVLGILILVRFIIGAVVALVLGTLQFRLVTSFRLEVIDSYTLGSWRSQSALAEGGLQQLFVTLPNTASSALSGLLTHLGHLLIMIAMLSYALLSDPGLTLGLVAAILVVTVAFVPLRRWIKSRSARVLVRQESLSTAASEMSALKFEAQAFGIGWRMANPIRDLVVAEGRLARRVSYAKAMVVPIYTTATYAAVTLGLVILAGATSDGLEDVGAVLLVILRSLAYGQGLQQAAVSIASLLPVLDLLQAHVDSFREQRLEWGSKPLNDVELIQLRGVDFSYTTSDVPALSNVDLEVFRGERLGVVGPSGGGKSTLIRVMLGLVAPTSGSVLVNGGNLFGYDREQWSQRIGVVPQAAQVLTGSIAANLRLFRDGISDDDLWWALEVADLADDVRQLRDGLASLLGPGGRSLSGGQQQRLAIARALSTRPDLVIMDEPTSSIDAMSEAAVSDAIDGLPKDVTVVIVSHRMRILRGCDRLVVVERGRITASGSPTDVLDSSTYLLAALEA